MTLHAGIVGARSSGPAVHAARWHRRPVNLAGFHDVNADVAQQAVSVYGGQGFSSSERLVHTVDVVQVCTMSPICRQLEYFVDCLLRDRESIVATSSSAEW